MSRPIHPELEEVPVAEPEAGASTDGWVDIDDLPGDWVTSPAGDQPRPFARVVDRTFTEHLDGFDTELTADDRVTLMSPFISCR